MTSRLDAVLLYAEDPPRVGRYWAGLLGRDLDTRSYVDVVPDDAGLRLRFVPTDEPRPDGLNKVHLHLTSDSASDQDERIRKALDLGGRHLDVGQLPEEGHVVLADPEGNEFCIIEPGNSFLARCGLLGELACDGSEAVGRFWSAALGWPLVWDQDGETAIQAPYGGTKIAWGGPPARPPRGRGGLHFDLTPPDGTDVETEAQRLVSLGATRVDTDASNPRVELADPDGNTFRVLSS